MHMTFAQTGRGDAQEAAVAAHLFQRRIAGIAHGGAQAADQLMQDGADRTLVGDAALDAFGHQLQLVADFLLEVAVGRAAAHGAEGDAAHEEEAAEEEGHVPVFVELPKMQANLIMTGKKQPFMVTTMVLEVGSPEEQKIVEEVQPRIENEIVTYLRSLRPEDVQGAAGLQRLREELLTRVKEAAKPAKVKDILFKEMLVQQ